MYKVYWTGVSACSRDFSELTKALEFAKELRSENKRFVAMVSENPNCTSLSGVDAVEDGCTPDGVPYTWRKRR